jgi:hypothetical protein
VSDAERAIPDVFFNSFLDSVPYLAVVRKKLLLYILAVYISNCRPDRAHFPSISLFLFVTIQICVSSYKALSPLCFGAEQARGMTVILPQFTVMLQMKL